MKAGQNDECDITDSRSCAGLLTRKTKKFEPEYIFWLQSCQPGAKVVPKFDCKIENSKTKCIYLYYNQSYSGILPGEALQGYVLLMQAKHNFQRDGRNSKLSRLTWLQAYTLKYILGRQNTSCRVGATGRVRGGGTMAFSDFEA